MLILIETLAERLFAGFHSLASGLMWMHSLNTARRELCRIPQGKGKKCTYVADFNVLEFRGFFGWNWL
jgi:hypothetical protein